MNKVAIIGSGPCGLSVMRAFNQAKIKGKKIPEIVCFEKQSDWGGLDQISMEIQFQIVCIDTFGLMDQKNVLSLLTILLMSILAKQSRPFPREKF